MLKYQCKTCRSIKTIQSNKKTGGVVYQYRNTKNKCRVCYYEDKVITKPERKVKKMKRLDMTMNKDDIIKMLDDVYQLGIESTFSPAKAKSRDMLLKRLQKQVRNA